MIRSFTIFTLLYFISSRQKLDQEGKEKMWEVEGREGEEEIEGEGFREGTLSLFHGI